MSDVRTEARRVGKYTLRFDSPPRIATAGVVVGPREGDGPLGKRFDHVYSDQKAGKDTFEQAEREMMINSCITALSRAGLATDDVDLLLAGDLLNQTVTANFTALKLDVPFMGLYGACATLGQALTLAGAILGGGFASRVLVAVSSHNGSAERQYRYPTEYGIKRPPYAQWTVTAAGAALLSASAGDGIAAVTHATVGRVRDMGIRDPFNLGAAMAPAAVDTMIRHFSDTGRDARDYDLVVTGDLGRFGREMAVDQAARSGITLGDNLVDCGTLIYDLERQHVFSGGSGAGCCAAVLFSDLLPRLERGDLRRILLVTTGALHSPTTYQQGEYIPTIAHAVSIERSDEVTTS